MHDYNSLHLTVVIWLTFTQDRHRDTHSQTDRQLLTGCTIIIAITAQLRKIYISIIFHQICSIILQTNVKNFHLATRYQIP